MKRTLLGAALAAALLAAGTPAAPASAAAPAPAGPALTADWQPPLRTQGRYIVDANGDRFKLKSANWHGAQGSWTGSGDRADPANHNAGEKSDQMPLGLDRAPVATILSDFHALGINSVRLPFSNEMLHDQRPVPDAAVAANPQLRGRTPLQVLDAVIAATTAEGFAVVLNNHTNTSRWCCGLDGNERWNTSRSTAQWEDDWLFMARRYRENKRVVGADLYNEVRRTITDDANWGWGDSHDWWTATQRLGDRILTEANPDLLVVVEGINWQGIPTDITPHWRPTLEPARTLSHTLVASDKLVYSAHFYGYTGPNHTGATGTGETHDRRYQELSRDELFATLRRQAFFVAADTGRHYTAPVWISEFGIGADETNPQARAWFGNFVDYLVANDTDFAYWPLVGFTGHGRWKLLDYDTEGRRSGILDGDDWRAADWRRLVTAPALTGPVPAAETWDMLNLDHADAVQSLRTRAGGDWDPGARKGVCPDGQRLVGLAHRDGRGLCTDAGAARLADPAGGSTVVTDERYVKEGDWAGGYTKLQCPRDRFMTGYSVRGQAVSAVLCAAASRALPVTGRTVWFDRGDNRPAGEPGGEFAQGDYKGQCATGEYAAGIAFTGAWAKGKTPDALLCRTL
ncbi:aryl-phospho-beta-D-glucosidase BglC (GH1 family) [Streptomyces sp. PanSC19]|uniref:glycoside hydrolase family 5 protein n=1 Tax=Streptomyces sp. PanSC19 TaxID=1520455 RepID=UPI000F466B69|nr:cellulase family glycosylhydrolase [Streptomyces sp. PanSC19]ROQ26911.1 aryl-phospho-beta-D-glucosidase BglC (GH1 family) [Streptomyces sp. PanSC19]